MSTGSIQNNLPVPPPEQSSSTYDRFAATGKLGDLDVEAIAPNPAFEKLKDDLTKKYGSRIASWAFPVHMPTSINPNFALSVETTAQAALTPAKTIDPLYNPGEQIKTGITAGGLSNGGVDCFINSSLQLMKALGLAIPENRLVDIPMLPRFLNNQLRSHNDCRALRQQINSIVITPSGNLDLKDIIINGTARSQQDATAFLRPLLEHVQAPMLSTVKKQSHPIIEGLVLDGPQEMHSIYPLTLPADEKTTIQQVIDHSFQSTVELDFGEIELTKFHEKTLIGNPLPESLIFSINRFDSSWSEDSITKGSVYIPIKKTNPIEGILTPITLSTENEESVRYEPTAIICHIGNSINSGHYVCYRKEHAQWLLYNDDYQVAQPATEEDYAFIKENCYVISYQKTEEPDPFRLFHDTQSV